MSRDKLVINQNLIASSPQNLYHGLYVRIAQKLGVDPSYVSRVARGERSSQEVAAALKQEIEGINRKLGSATVTARPAPAQSRSRGKRLKTFVAQERDSLRQEWLRQCQGDPDIRRIKLSRRRRVAPVLPIVDEALKRLRFGVRKMASRSLNAAKRHGAERRRQGYTPASLLEEYNLIRRCVYQIADKNLERLNPRVLLNDLGQFGEVLDLQVQSAIKAFLAADSVNVRI
jgi:transcriptional regulator with XRE-family HTH domain